MSAPFDLAVRPQCSPKILFVHHQPVNLTQVNPIISHLFQRATVYFTTNMQETIHSAANAQYDLIFIEDDSRSPETGIMITQALRAQNITIPVVCFSENNNETKQRCLESGMMDAMVEAFLRKHMIQPNQVMKRELLLSDEPSILIIDDRPNDFKIVISRDMIGNLFPKAKLDIVETEADALKILQGQIYDVIFIDFNLANEIKGDMVAARLRRAGVTTYLVGFSVDMAEPAKRNRCLDAGMDDAIQPQELIRFLDAHRANNNKDQG